MANFFLKAEQIAATALGLLEREVVLPRLVWRDAVGNFTGAKNDTVTIRVPAYVNARTRVMRGDTGYTVDEIAENAIPMTLDTDVYKAIGVTDEQLTLDIRDFGAQVLQPAMSSVARGVEDELAGFISAQTYENEVTIGSDDPYDTLIDARQALNDARVPFANRNLIVGSGIEATILKSDRLSVTALQGGDSTAFRDATIGRIAGFTAVAVPGLAPDEAYAFHQTAFALSMRAPVVPSGVAFGASQAYNGMSLRVIRDYDFDNVRDRLLVNTYMGDAAVTDRGTVDGDGRFVPTDTHEGGSSLLVRAVKINLTSGS